jgi:hypothetical protein
MLHVTVPNIPETLTYSVIGSLVVEVLLALLLAVRGDGLGALMVLAVAGVLYWFVCRQLVAVVSAGFAVAASGALLLLSALIELVGGYPYQGLLFIVAALVLGFVFVLLQQGALPAELRIGGVFSVGVPSRVAQLRMLEELRDAGLLTTDEFAAKQAMLGL